MHFEIGVMFLPYDQLTESFSIFKGDDRKGRIRVHAWFCSFRQGHQRKAISLAVYLHCHRNWCRVHSCYSGADHSVPPKAEAGEEIPES